MTMARKTPNTGAHKRASISSSSGGPRKCVLISPKLPDDRRLMAMKGDEYRKWFEAAINGEIDSEYIHVTYEGLPEWEANR
jgi:hypothetical protein